MNEARDYLRKAGLTEGQIGNLEAMGYFRQPASKGHHLSGYGGLAKHSVNVTERLVELTKALQVRWPREESPWVTAIATAIGNPIIPVPGMPTPIAFL